MTRAGLTRAAGGALALLLAACGGAPGESAQAEPERPDFSGFYMLGRTAAIDEELRAKISPDAVILEDTGAPEYGPGDFGGLKLTPRAMEVAKAWKIEDDMTVSNTCRIPSIIYAMQGPFPIEIHQGRDLMVIRLEYFDMARVIFLDGREHLPDGAPVTKVGNSVGHWEGDTLVVETRHLKEATITNNGLFHGDRARVIERFKLSPDGQQLLATQEFEDPDMLENKGARFISWDRVEGDHVRAYDCDPAFAENYAN
jgi:hypothetical protein